MAGVRRTPRIEVGIAGHEPTNAVWKIYRKMSDLETFYSYQSCLEYVSEPQVRALLASAVRRKLAGMTKEERWVIRSAMARWRMWCPQGWSIADHIGAPCVNTCTPSERRLAKDCASLEAAKIILARRKARGK